MDNHTRLESTVEQLQQAVLALQQRIELLEAGRPAAAGHTQSATSPEAATTSVRKRAANDPIAILSLIGRLFLVLAGGFFLRAMTESGVLATTVGLSIGFAYAMLWLVFADRAGRSQQVHSAFFHALATALIAFPLLVEAATKFKVLPGVPSVLAVATLCAAMLFVAWHQRLQVVAWIAVLAAIPTSAVLLSQTGAVAPYALFLIVLGIATLWLGNALGWWGLRWPTALAADLAVVGVTLRVLAPEQQDSAVVAIALQLTLLGAYVTSIAVRTLIRGRNVVPFEVAQTAAALIVGFGGALYLTNATGILPATIGWVGVVLGIASYGVAIVFLDRRQDSARNVYHYTTLGLVLVIAGLSLVIDEPWLGVVLSVLAVLAAWSWSRFGRSFMLVHAACYLVAAGVVSGVLAYSLRAVAVAGADPWITPSVEMGVALAAALLAAGFASARRKPKSDEIASGLRLIIALVLIAAAAACVIGFLGPVAAGRPDRRLDPGAFATVGTGVLALGVLIVAWLGRNPRFREWTWLVYPLLVGIGLKMAMQDFKLSRPATLFIAMALYGTALIVAPRLRKGAARTNEDPVETEQAIGNNA